MAAPKTREKQAKDAHAANAAAVQKSIDEWRAMQGLPPIDRSQPKETK